MLGHETDSQTLATERTARILVAEDDPHVRRILTVLLGRRWKIDAAQDGEEAWQMAIVDPPDLILSDVMMPRVDGISLLLRLRADHRTQSIPVILLSARAGEDETISGLEAGADDYLAKPFSTRELMARVQTRLEITAMRERNAQQAEALAALQRQQEWTKTLFDSLPVPTLLLDPGSGEVRLANRAAARMAGAALEPGATLDAAGMILQLDGTDAGRPVASSQLAPLTHQGESHDLRLLWQTPTGTYRVLADSVVLPTEVGQRASTLLVLRDVTPLVEREEELRRALHSRDDFLSVASHELRTPLTTLGLHVDGLLRAIEAGRAGGALEAGTVRRLEGIRRQMARVDDLLERLLDASRLAAGTVQLQPEKVDVVELAQDVMQALRPAADDVGSELRLIAPGSAQGEWDRRRVQQVLNTLLSNAVKFGGGQPVEVTIDDDGRRVRVSVKDHGLGIAIDKQTRVFERFARVVSERHFPGLGLGLWSARRILEAFGGSIAVDSEPGRGSTFTIELPRDSGHQP